MISVKNRIPLLIVVTLLFASHSFSTATAREAVPEPEIKKYGLITPPTCITPDGEKIGIYPGTSEQIVSFGGFLAAAGDFEVGKNGGIVNEDRIYYDETNMPFLHPLFQKFLFHHECGHITRGHLEINPLQRQTMYFKLEQEADCEGLAAIKETSDNFSHDSEIVISNFTFIAEKIMPAATPAQEAARAKLIQQRVKNIHACPVFSQ